METETLVVLVVILLVAGGAAYYVHTKTGTPTTSLSQTPTSTGSNVVGGIANVANKVGGQTVGSVAKRVASYGLVGVTGPIALSSKGIDYVGSGAKSVYNKVGSWF